MRSQRRSKRRSGRKHASVFVKTSRRKTRKPTSQKKLSRGYRGDEGFEPVSRTVPNTEFLRREKHGGRLRHNGTHFWKALDGHSTPSGDYIWNTNQNDGQSKQQPDEALELKLLARDPGTLDDELQKMQTRIIETTRPNLDPMPPGNDLLSRDFLRNKNIFTALQAMIQEFEMVGPDKDFLDASSFAFHSFDDFKKEHEYSDVNKDVELFIKLIITTMQTYKNAWESKNAKDHLTHGQLFALAAFRGAAD